jgi:hypothetical protein
MSLLVLLSLVALPRSITNTEAVHGLARLGDDVVACTEGGVDVFSADGAWRRTLHVEDGLPSHGCRALREAFGAVFAATDQGLVELVAGRGGIGVVGLSAARWHAVPEAASRSELLARIAWLEASLPSGSTGSTGSTWTAFSAHYAGTADGQVRRLGTTEVHTAPGAVLYLEEYGEALRIGTSEGLFVLRGERFVELPSPPAPLSFSGDLVLSRDGRAFRWGDTLAPTGEVGPAEPTAWLERDGARWVGTRSDGVHLVTGGVTRGVTRGGARVAPRRVTPTGQLCGNHVTAIARAGSRTVVGTFDRGVCWEERGRWVRARVPALPSDQVLGLAVDGERLYVATTHGLGFFDGRRWIQVAFGGRNPLGLARLSVLATQVTADGVWVMDGRGASRAARGKTLRLEARTTPPERWAEHPTVATLAGAFLWYASEDRGLLRFDGERWARFHDGKDLTDNWVTAIDGDANGRLVAGTCQRGFNYFDGTGWVRVPDISTGLPSAMVTAVALTATGAFIGTLGGLARYDAAGGSLTQVPGLADARVAALLVDGERLYVGTEGGLSVAAP